MRGQRVDIGHQIAAPNFGGVVQTLFGMSREIVTCVCRRSEPTPRRLFEAEPVPHEANDALLHFARSQGRPMSHIAIRYPRRRETPCSCAPRGCRILFVSKLAVSLRRTTNAWLKHRCRLTTYPSESKKSAASQLLADCISGWLRLVRRPSEPPHP